jgi:hypothetical protein
VGSGTRADRLVFADGGASSERAHGQPVQATIGGNDCGTRTTRSHHAVDGVAPEINDREE